MKLWSYNFSYVNNIHILRNILANGVPEGYRVQYINGFVEELVMNNDPEYQWIDKIRTPRAYNEARQTLFLKLSGIIQRKIGLKALELGGNAVLGLVYLNVFICNTFAIHICPFLFLGDQKNPSSIVRTHYLILTGQW